jgi:hypothetical protein
MKKNRLPRMSELVSAAFQFQWRIHWRGSPPSVASAAPTERGESG